ncbi:hypothetical protein SOVF_062160, partial [Spinacia oleracea]
ISSSRADFLKFGLPLYKAALEGNWPAAEHILQQSLDWIRHPIAKGGERVLHIAATAKCTHFVKELVKLMIKGIVRICLESVHHRYGLWILVWSLVRRFDQPQKYKPFVSRCVVQGNLEIGSVREVDVKSGLPATTSTERLEVLDDNEHILSIRIVGGDHRLRIAQYLNFPKPVYQFLDISKNNATVIVKTDCGPIAYVYVGGPADKDNRGRSTPIETVEHAPGQLTAWFIVTPPTSLFDYECIFSDRCLTLATAKQNLAKKAIHYLMAVYSFDVVDANYNPSDSKFGVVLCTLERESYLTLKERVLGIEEELEPSLLLVEQDCITPWASAYRIPSIMSCPLPPTNRKHPSLFQGRPLLLHQRLSCQFFTQFHLSLTLSSSARKTIKLFRTFYPN